MVRQSVPPPIDSNISLALIITSGLLTLVSKLMSWPKLRRVGLFLDLEGLDLDFRFFASCLLDASLSVSARDGEAESSSSVYLTTFLVTARRLRSPSTCFRGAITTCVDFAGTILCEDTGGVPSLVVLYMFSPDIFKELSMDSEISSFTFSSYSSLGRPLLTGSLKTIPSVLSSIVVGHIFFFLSLMTLI